MSVRKQLCIVIVLLSAALMALQAHLYFLGGSTTTADAAKAAADPESASALPGTHVPSAEAAIAWVRQYGGEVGAVCDCQQPAGASDKVELWRNCRFGPHPRTSLLLCEGERGYPKAARQGTRHHRCA